MPRWDVLRKVLIPIVKAQASLGVGAGPAEGPVGL